MKATTIDAEKNIMQVKSKPANGQVSRPILALDTLVNYDLFIVQKVKKRMKSGSTTKGKEDEGDTTN